MQHSTKRIDGRQLAEVIYQRIRKNLSSASPTRIQNHHRPGLAIVQIPERTDVVSFEAEKAHAARKCQFYYEIHRLSSQVTMKALHTKIASLNTNERIDGIVVQLPLPKHLIAHEVTTYIDLKKDVDGLHPQHAGELWMGSDLTCTKPCTAVAVERMIATTSVPLRGAHAVIIGSGIISGCPIARFLMRQNATVTICNASTMNIADTCRQADILISAAGHPGLVQGHWVKPGAVVVDVGITRTADGIRGDVDWKAIQGIAAFATPVPGGVGPLAVAGLMENTCHSFLTKNEDSSGHAT